ncbi:MAG TPA: YceI family protein [Solirubrobacteraceae bacterium]|nr:YceI family protein [Solirubrobacteraceae bacterium]
MSIYSTPLSGTYAADPVHSNFGFAIKFMGSSTFKGTLDKVTAKLDAAPHGVTLTGAAEIQSISIRTPEQFRAHVLSDEFFAAEAYPQIMFTSDDVSLGVDGTATIEGKLTIKDTTQPVTAHGTWGPTTTDPLGKTRAHLALEATINRRDYGINWNAPLPNGGSVLADDVVITVELPLVATE